MSLSFLDRLSSDQGDKFDDIRCPNTFDDNSQVDKYFDSHRTTPSPTLRRSKRLAEKSLESQPPAKRVSNEAENDKEVGKSSQGSSRSYLSCETSTPYHTPKEQAPIQLAKNTTTPGPPLRSLLKFAIGNATLQKAEAVLESATADPNSETTIVAAEGSGIQTSTPKVRKTLRTKKVLDESVKIVKNASSRPTVIKKTAGLKSLRTVSKPAKSTPKIIMKKNRRSSSSSGVTASRRTVLAASQFRNVAPKVVIRKKVEPKSRAVNNTVAKKPAVSREPRKKAVIAKPQTVSKSGPGTSSNGVTVKAKAKQYANVKSKVAEMIHNGKVGNKVVFKDIKSRENKEVKKPLHDKPFIPTGKIKYEPQIDIRPGDMTIGGQTMAQFVKNFHYATPKRYRTLKPTDNFQNTCTDHKVAEANPTIPKSPKFATNSRRRKMTKK